MFIAKAPGKIILTGEHAVVYGIPGIALPVFDCYATTELKPLNYDKIIIKAPQLQKIFELDFSKENQNPLELTVINFLKKYSLEKTGYELIINSQLPIASGMGSGAAISTSIIKVLAEFYELKIDKEEIFNQVYEIEKIYHGNPSGIDPKVIVYEKPFYFIKNQKMEALEISAKFSIAIIDSEIKSSTKKVVDWVGEQNKKYHEKYNQIFSKIENITNQLKEALKENNISYIGELLNKNHVLLQQMGVSNHKLDFIVEKANLSGAEGSKMSGAGWGGIVISILKKENKEIFCENMKKNGITNIIFSDI